jgi:hypothetical protein
MREKVRKTAEFGELIVAGHLRSTLHSGAVR